MHIPTLREFGAMNEREFDTEYDKIEDWAYYGNVEAEKRIIEIDAIISAVRPFLFRAFTSAPASSSSPTISTSPSCVAL